MRTLRRNTGNRVLKKSGISLFYLTKRLVPSFFIFKTLTLLSSNMFPFLMMLLLTEIGCLSLNVCCPLITLITFHIYLFDMCKINPCIANMSDYLEFADEKFSKLNVYNCEFSEIDENTHVNLYSFMSSYVCMYLIQYCDEKILHVTFVSHVGLSSFYSRLLQVCQKLNVTLL